MNSSLSRAMRVRRTGNNAFFSLLMFAVLLAAPLSGTAADPSATIRELEDEMAGAFNKYDAATLDRLWDDDLVFVFPNGVQASKAERLAGLKEVPAYIPQSTNESMEFRVLSDAVIAVVVSRWPIVREGKTTAIRFRATHVWVQRKDTWKLLAAHVSQMRE